MWFVQYISCCVKEFHSQFSNIVANLLSHCILGCFIGWDSNTTNLEHLWLFSDMSIEREVRCFHPLLVYFLVNQIISNSFSLVNLFFDGHNNFTLNYFVFCLWHWEILSDSFPVSPFYLYDEYFIDERKIEN